MAKEIVVNVGERETRIAVVEDGKLVELHIERAERVVGSLYKCRVSNVIQGIDAAFVDIGLDRNAFLAVGDVLPSNDTDSAPPASAPNAEPRNGSAGGNGRDRREQRYGKDARGSRDRRETPRPSPGLQMPAEVVAAGRADVTSAEPSSSSETGMAEAQENSPASANAPEITNVSAQEAGEANGFEETNPFYDPQVETNSGDDTDDSGDQNSRGFNSAKGLMSREDSEDADDAGEDDSDEIDFDEDEEDDEEDEEEDQTGTTANSAPGARGSEHRPMRFKAGYRRSALRQQRIGDVLKVGQEVLVQVIKGTAQHQGGARFHPHFPARTLPCLDARSRQSGRVAQNRRQQGTRPPEENRG